MDRRRGASLTDIYALSVAAGGSVTPGWPDDGLLLCGSGTASEPIPVPDGAGGALVLWMDSRPPYPNVQIYAQRVGANGVIAPGWPVGGKAITSGGPFVVATKLFDALPDGAGGAYFARKHDTDLGALSRGAVSRITADGNYASGWTEAGLVFGPNSVTHRDAAISGRLSADPGSGVFFSLVWSHWQHPETSYGATLARISSGGASLWSVSVPTHWSGNFSLDGIRSIAATSDGNGGCFATWLDAYWTPAEYRYDEFAQRYSSAGAPQWSADTPSPSYQHVESDGAGGVYLIGSLYGASRLEVHRRRADGSVPDGWTASGITVTEPSAMGAISRSSFLGDLLLCWSENRTGSGFDIRAIAIDSSGAVVSGWESDGRIVSDATGDQTVPDLATMSPARALGCWQDGRTGSWDIRATRIAFSTTGVGPGPEPAVALALGVPWPNPARDRLRFGLSTPGAGAASLDVLDVTGRAVARLGPVEAGVTGTSFEVNVRGFANGVYWLRLSQGGHTASRRFAVLN